MIPIRSSELHIGLVPGKTDRMTDSSSARADAGDARTLPPGVFTRSMVLAIPGMDDIPAGVTMTAGGGPEAPRVTIYRPRSGARHPVLAFVPGGPVPAPANPSEWGIFTSYGRAAAAQGFLGVVVSHRFHEPGDVGPASARLDAALAWLTTNAAGLDADADHLAVWGFSGAGSLLAPMIRRPPRGLCALVLFYAGLDVGSDTLERDPSARRWSAVAAMEEVDSWSIPLVVARAGRDAPELNAAIDRFVARALERAAPLDLLTHPAGRHGFDLFDDDDRSRDIIARAFQIVRTATA
jgi:dienelactone hydrolase